MSNPTDVNPTAVINARTVLLLLDSALHLASSLPAPSLNPLSLLEIEQSWSPGSSLPPSVFQWALIRRLLVLGQPLADGLGWLSVWILEPELERGVEAGE